MRIVRNLEPERASQLDYAASQAQDAGSKMDMLAMLAGVDPEEWAAVTTDETTQGIAQEVHDDERNV